MASKTTRTKTTPRRTGKSAATRGSKRTRRAALPSQRTTKAPLGKRQRAAVTKRIPTTVPGSRARGTRPPHPTDGHDAVLRVYAELLEKLGREPSMREISKELDISEKGAHHHVLKLTAKGYLREKKALKVVGREMTALAKKYLE